jgi:aspartate/methionine/tyrosine aminotransferase
MNPLADELNSVLDGTIAGRLLSNLGRRFYFPKGIIAQSLEAKKSARFANGTIGMACRDGKPLILSAIADSMPTLSPDEAVAYAPTAGVEKARQVWKDLIIRKNPSLDPNRISMPVVVPGLTAGLSCTADMFIGKGNSLLTSDPCWDNYPLIFETRRGAELRGVPFFGHDFGGPESGKGGTGTGLDMDLIGGAVRETAGTGTLRIIFNFPNNPSGYSPTRDEEEAIVGLIRGVAEGGTDVLVICDDAYFGLFYEENIGRESLFVRFADLHERVLAIKVDGPIKEDYVWGLRMGFLTFGSRGLGTEQYNALVRKLMGAIRSSVSCANTPAQYLMLKAMEDGRTEGEKRHYRQIMKARYEKVKHAVSAHRDHPALKPLPFNSGYFMCFRCLGVDPETLRQELLHTHGIGAVSLGEHYLRIAFSGIEEEKIPQVYETVYDTALKLRREDF